MQGADFIGFAINAARAAFAEVTARSVAGCLHLVLLDPALALRPLPRRDRHTPGRGRMCATMPMRHGFGLTRTRKQRCPAHIRT